MNDALIEAKNFSIEIGKRAIVSDSSFAFQKGDIVLLDGENGTGKTTLLRALLGIYGGDVHCSGQISISNSSNVLDMKDKELLNLRSQIGYLEQKDSYDSYYSISVKDVLVDSMEAYLNSRLTKADFIRIENIFSEYLPKGANITLKSKVNKLSGGQQRIVSIIASLCLRSDAKIFIIDEPLNNLDINTIVYISNILNAIRIKNPDSMMLIVSHCKIFPFINKVATIRDHTVEISDRGIVCNACFGQPDENGFYN